MAEHLGRLGEALARRLLPALVAQPRPDHRPRHHREGRSCAEVHSHRNDQGAARGADSDSTAHTLSDTTTNSISKLELKNMQKAAARKEKTAAAREPAIDLRGTLEWLKSQGDLIETDKPVNPDLEVTGLQKHLDGGCPVLFNNVKGKPHHRVLTNLFGDINVINKMFGWKDDVERTRKLAYALSHPLKPVEILQSEAPCQEHVIKNPKDVNEHMVAIRHTTYEPELTVGSGIRCVTGPQFDGGSDLGYNRMNFRWGNVGTFQISPGSHMWQVVNKYYKANEPVPITMCFGVPPACTLLAGAGFDYAVLPMGCDEIGIAGAVQGAPIRLV